MERYEENLVRDAKSRPKQLFNNLIRRYRETHHMSTLISQNGTVSEDTIQKTETLAAQYRSVLNTASSAHVASSTSSLDSTGIIVVSVTPPLV